MSPGTVDFHSPPGSTHLSPGGIDFPHSRHPGDCRVHSPAEGIMNEKLLSHMSDCSRRNSSESISTSSEESEPAAPQGAPSRPHRAGSRPSQWSPLLPKKLPIFRTSLLLQGRNGHYAYGQLLPQARLCPLSRQIHVTTLGQRYYSFHPHLTKEQSKVRNIPEVQAQSARSQRSGSGI